MAKNLVIVESPAKAKTIEGYLGKDYKVVSSYGHVRDLIKGNKAIDIEGGFKPTYDILPDKKQVVKELKKLAKEAEMIWLATDDDREGEAISWHLKEALSLKKEKTQRIIFREITKKAIQRAIENPGTINEELVNAQQARRILDRLVGFELSPILWKKVKAGLSAGRVQSVAVRLVVEKERDIENFKADDYFRVVGYFENKEGKSLKAELSKRFKNLDEAKGFLEKCKESNYAIDKLEVKPSKKSPAPPFTTSTLQQEASRKLNFPVGLTMSVAQKLYEAGKITYMRTDSVNLSEDAISAARNEVQGVYGNDFFKERHYKSKSQGAQEAHEAIRPTDFSKHSLGGSSAESKLYELIWKRAIASQMSDAIIKKTTAKIGISNNSDLHFTAKGEMIEFEGFIKAYQEGKDEDDHEEESGMLPQLSESDDLNNTNITATQRFTRPPSRYTEASLVKKLEELGIGRPSTYAPTISTIQKRNYAVKEEKQGEERKYHELVLENNKIKDDLKTEITGAEKNKLSPTEEGFVVNDFLVKYFPNIFDYSFTAKIEKDFDEIAHGNQNWDNMIKSFYKDFHPKVETTENISKEESGAIREIGVDPKSGNKVFARIGRYGPMVQLGEAGEGPNAEKPKFASLKKGQHLEDVTLEEALELFEFPKTIGEYEGKEVVVATGRYGPFVKFDEMYVSLAKNEEMESVDMERAIELIEAKRKADAPIDQYEGLPVQKGVGRFGPFLKWNNMFINVNKKYDFDNLSHSDIEELIEDKKRKEIEKFVHNWEDEGISVQKARWGKHVIVKNKKKLIELPKTTDVKDFTLEQVKQMIADQAAQKKKPAKKKTSNKK